MFKRTINYVLSFIIMKGIFYPIKQNCSFFKLLADKQYHQLKNNDQHGLKSHNKNITNWKIILFPIMQDMLQRINLNNNEYILINRTKNQIDESLDCSLIILNLIKIINTLNNNLHIIEIEKLIKSNKILNLSLDDNFVSKDKAISMAKCIHAKYVLYSIVSGDIKHLKLDLQLIIAQTGEILWHYINDVK